MSAAEIIGATSFRMSAPSFGGIRVSFGNGEPSMISPTAAIEILSTLVAGVGVAETSAKWEGSIPVIGREPQPANAAIWTVKQKTAVKKPLTFILCLRCRILFDVSLPTID